MVLCETPILTMMLSASLSNFDQVGTLFLVLTVLVKRWNLKKSSGGETFAKSLGRTHIVLQDKISNQKHKILLGILYDFVAFVNISQNNCVLF